MYRGITVGNGKATIISRPSTSAIQPSCVRLRPIYAGICGSDLHALNGKFFEPPSQVIRGHEVTAVVQEVGIGVNTLKVGDKVVLEPLKRCGVCPSCLKKKFNLCHNLSIFGGGLSEELTVPASSLFLLPDEVSLAVGVLTEPLAVMIHAFRKAGCETSPVENAAVLGAGSIGLLGIVVAHHFGVRKFAISYRYSYQCEVAQSIAKYFGIEIEVIPAAETVQYFEDKERPDLVVETVGGFAPTASDALKILNPGGTLVVLGLFEPDAPRPDMFTLMCKEATIIGSLCYDHCHSVSDFSVAMSILKIYGEFLFETLVTHEFQLEEAEKAFQTARDKGTEKAIKIVFKLNEQ